MVADRGNAVELMTTSDEEVDLCPGVEVAAVSLECAQLMERLEPGVAVWLKKKNDPAADGGGNLGLDLIDCQEVYSVGGARQKLVVAEVYSVEESGGGAAEGEVEIVRWEAADRLLLACPNSTKLSVLW